LRGKSRAGLLKTEKTFAVAADQFPKEADQFLKEYEVNTEGHRSPRWIEGHHIRVRLHLKPFFGSLGLSEITPGKVQEYRMHRATTPPTYTVRGRPKLGGTVATAEPKPFKPPARSTQHDEIVTLRMVLKTAIRYQWLSHLPDLSPPYKTQGKVTHRAWFSPEEYTTLYAGAREYKNTCWKNHRWGADQVYDYVLFMANPGLRPDEANNLQHRDVKIVDD
jgi:hypothetical protein